MVVTYHVCDEYIKLDVYCVRAMKQLPIVRYVAPLANIIQPNQSLYLILSAAYVVEKQRGTNTSLRADAKNHRL